MVRGQIVRPFSPDLPPLVLQVLLSDSSTIASPTRAGQENGKECLKGVNLPDPNQATCNFSCSRRQDADCGCIPLARPYLGLGPSVPPFPATERGLLKHQQRWYAHESGFFAFFDAVKLNLDTQEPGAALRCKLLVGLIPLSIPPLL